MDINERAQRLWRAAQPRPVSRADVAAMLRAQSKHVMDKRDSGKLNAAGIRLLERAAYSLLVDAMAVEDER